MRTRRRVVNVCVMRGFYDEAGEYREETMENVGIYELPQDAIERINFRYDITTLYSKCDVLVISKNIQNIDEYKTLVAKPRFFHDLLHRGRRDNCDAYRCIVANLGPLKKTNICI